ncbi:hypothetical protein [Microbacterium cremeum]|uniref:hypothetical protein n=1 Tax=Microbacterium cremeum TaxID=2782169 RepID=UPI001888D121|nr:hypothetical protein [Microbacterium cremeum]
MTSKLRSLAAAAASVVLLLSIAACASPAPTPSPTATGESSLSVTTDAACTGDSGVTVVVDASAFEGESQETCVIADETIGAADALALAGVETEGTEEYGDQVVCRVNGVPAEDTAIPAEDGSDYFETCAAMPAAFAYWSLWVKPAGGEWGYAQEGLSTLQLEPGDAVELLFTLHGEPAAPTT